MKTPKTWKDALTRYVFDWQVYAASQPSRALGWLAAAEEVYRFFGDKRTPEDAGSCLTLAANTSGPVGKCWTLKDKGWEGPTAPPGCGSEDPYSLLLRLEAKIRSRAKSLDGPSGEEWAQSTCGPGFDSPKYAAGLAANQVHTVIQEYACPHKHRKRIHGGGYEEPYWEATECQDCKKVMGHGP